LDYEYRVVDVFTQTPLEGNGLAVFLDASGMSDATMQRVAREMNLSETSFILPAASDERATRVRIFTPNYEMEFAGHPTIGTAFVMRDAGVVARDASAFVLKENVGNVPVRVERGGLIWLTTPPITTAATFDRRLCAEAVSLQESDLLPNLPCELRTAGNPNIYIPVRDQATVDRAVVDSAAFYNLIAPRNGEATCIFVFAPTKEGAYSRMFAPELGVVEDPATGSATGPLAQYMMAHGIAPHQNGARFLSEQGTKMGRRSILHILVHGDHGRDGIEVGGYVTPVAKATLTI
jgi:trans-2,3-dihydro-3-hydroxyanthranilate isomerase